MFFVKIIVFFAIAALMLVLPRLRDQKMQQKIESGVIPSELKEIKKIVNYMKDNSYPEADIVEYLEKCDSEVKDKYTDGELLKFYDYAISNSDSIECINTFLDFSYSRIKLIEKKEKLTNPDLDEIYGLYCLSVIYDRPDISQELLEFADSNREYKSLADDIRDSSEDIEMMTRRIDV